MRAPFFKLPLFQSARPWFFLALLLGSVAISRAAVSFSPSPASVSNTYAGAITLTITGLDPGETVIVEKFVDNNGNNQIDGSEPLIQRFQLTDGVVTSIGGVRNQNVPGDEDAVSGQITAALDFAHASEGNRGVGAYRYRLSSPNSHFAPVEQEFIVTATAYPQSIGGKAYAGAQVLPFALIAFLQPSPDGVDFIAGTYADAGGNFNLPMPTGTYQVAAFGGGLNSVGRSSVLPVVSLQAAVNASANVTNVVSTRTISGKVKDLQSNAGLPGVQLFLQSTDGDQTLGFADSTGNFSVPVTVGAQWMVGVSDQSLNLLGYLNTQQDAVFNTAAGNATQDIALPRALVLIHGILKNEAAVPIANAEIRADDYDLYIYTSSGFTRADGSYFLGAMGNVWQVQPEPSSLLKRGFLTTYTNLFFANGNAVTADLEARTITAHLRGQVLRTDGQPVMGLELKADSGVGYANSSTTDSNGEFAIGVSAGSWSLAADSYIVASMNLVQPALPPFNVQAGVDINNILYVVQMITGGFSGNVQDKDGLALVGVNVTASITLNGTNYMASALTDENGNYQIGAFNGIWSLSLEDIGNLGYQTPGARMVTVQNNTPINNFVVDPVGPLQIDSNLLPGGTIGVAYGFTLAASGGVPPYLWSKIGGSLGNLILAPDGTISGTESAAITDTFTALVEDNNGGSVSKTFSVTIYPRPALQAVTNLSATQFQLTLTAQPDRDYVIERSTNLTAATMWVPVSTNSAANGIISFTDTQATNKYRYYRARER